MDKIDVNGPNTDPVYQLLKGPGGADINWNFFSKFLVSCDANDCKIQRFDGAPAPLSLEKDIVAALG
jgi:glutathione peroxidase